MRNFNETQKNMIDYTIEAGISTITRTFQKNKELAKYTLELLITLNRYSILHNLMSENPNEKFTSARIELNYIILRSVFSTELEVSRAIFNLCGRQTIDHRIIFPLKRLQEPYGFSDAQHEELRTYIQEKLQVAINDLEPRTQKRARPDEQPRTNKRHRSAAEPETKAAKPSVP